MRRVKKTDIIHDCVNDWEMERLRIEERVSTVREKMRYSSAVDKFELGRIELELAFERDMKELFRGVEWKVSVCKNTADKLFGTMETTDLDIRKYKDEKAELEKTLDRYEKSTITGKWE